MDPITLIGIGSGLLRLTGQAFGGKTAATTEKIANVVDQVRGLPAKVAEAQMGAALAGLDAEEFAEIKRAGVRAMEIKAEVEKARIAGDTAQHAETQATARIEAASEDAYVRRTRPGMARKSFWLSVGYAFAAGVAFPLLNAMYGWQLPAVDSWILGALLSPALSYMGVRSIDAFSRKGKTGA